MALSTFVMNHYFAINQNPSRQHLFFTFFFVSIRNSTWNCQNSTNWMLISETNTFFLIDSNSLKLELQLAICFIRYLGVFWIFRESHYWIFFGSWKNFEIVESWRRINQSHIQFKDQRLKGVIKCTSNRF